MKGYRKTHQMKKYLRNRRPITKRSEKTVVSNSKNLSIKRCRKKTKNRRQIIAWFNPPFNKNVCTNVAKLLKIL